MPGASLGVAVRMQQEGLELLRSPKASEGQGGALGEAEALKRGNTVGVRDQVMDLVASQGMKVSRAEVNLPTPTVSDLYTANLASSQQKDGSLHSVTLAQVFHREDLFPTPTTRDYKDGTAEHERDGVVQTDTVARAVFNSGEIDLIGTPRASASESSSVQVAKGAPKGRIEDQVLLMPTPNTMEHLPARSGEARERQLRRGNPEGSRRATSGNLREDILDATAWGKFEPAIRRWEQVLGRPAPAPTKPDGKEGNHRLSSAFTEWMMGVPEGWITEAGISRNEELKAAGNGVVPQQAELALRILLDGVPLD